MEKEALAIVEAVRKWAHLLTGRCFKIVTDQRSVTFMYNNENHGKIKNDKVLRWQMELSEFAFDIAYRSGKLNAAPDALSQVYCAAMRENTLYNIHVSLCHPGVTRLIMFAARFTRVPDPSGEHGALSRKDTVVP